MAVMCVAGPVAVGFTGNMFLYVALINIVAFIAYGIDKLKAERRVRRVPEAVLFLFAYAGGSIGAWLGMKVWHHKTLHKRFRIRIPLIMLVQLAVCLCCYAMLIL